MNHTHAQHCSEQQIEREAERAGIRAVITIAIGVFVVCAVLGVIMYGWKLAALSAVGLTLYSIVFGYPFWLATIDSQIEDARRKCGDPNVPAH